MADKLEYHRSLQRRRIRAIDSIVQLMDVAIPVHKEMNDFPGLCERDSPWKIPMIGNCTEMIIGLLTQTDVRG
jgi:hypothetical protein